jgi:hypothetical protein
MKERLIARRIEKEALRGNEKASHCLIYYKGPLSRLK